MQAQFSGVKNKSEKPKVWSHDGQPYNFEPGEVKILQADVANFLSTRVEYLHAQDKDGKFIGLPQGSYPFELMPLHEALKVAKLDENPSVVEARKKQEQDETHKAALREEIQKLLLEQGWKPPKEPEASKKDKENHK